MSIFMKGIKITLQRDRENDKVRNRCGKWNVYVRESMTNQTGNKRDTKTLSFSDM